MELMEHWAMARHAPIGVGTTLALITALAVFVLGAPPWILIPISVTGATVLAELRLRAQRRTTDTERRR